MAQSLLTPRTQHKTKGVGVALAFLAWLTLEEASPASAHAPLVGGRGVSPRGHPSHQRKSCLGTWELGEAAAWPGKGGRVRSGQVCRLAFTLVYLETKGRDPIRLRGGTVTLGAGGKPGRRWEAREPAGQWDDSSPRWEPEDYAGSLLVVGCV